MLATRARFFGVGIEIIGLRWSLWRPVAVDRKKEKWHEAVAVCSNGKLVLIGRSKAIGVYNYDSSGRFGRIHSCMLGFRSKSNIVY